MPALPFRGSLYYRMFSGFKQGTAVGPEGVRFKGLFTGYGSLNKRFILNGSIVNLQTNTGTSTLCLLIKKSSHPSIHPLFSFSFNYSLSTYSHNHSMHFEQEKISFSKL